VNSFRSRKKSWQNPAQGEILSHQTSTRKSEKIGYLWCDNEEVRLKKYIYISKNFQQIFFSDTSQHYMDTPVITWASSLFSKPKSLNCCARSYSDDFIWHVRLMKSPLWGCNIPSTLYRSLIVQNVIIIIFIQKLSRSTCNTNPPKECVLKSNHLSLHSHSILPPFIWPHIAPHRKQPV
jgi:hypothetical protein